MGGENIEVGKALIYERPILLNAALRQQGGSKTSGLLDTPQCPPSSGNNNARVSCSKNNLGKNHLRNPANNSQHPQSKGEQHNGNRSSDQRSGGLSNQMKGRTKFFKAFINLNEINYYLESDVEGSYLIDCLEAENVFERSIKDLDSNKQGLTFKFLNLIDKVMESANIESKLLLRFFKSVSSSGMLLKLLSLFNSTGICQSFKGTIKRDVNQSYKLIKQLLMYVPGSTRDDISLLMSVLSRIVTELGDESLLAQHGECMTLLNQAQLGKSKLKEEPFLEKQRNLHDKESDDAYKSEEIIPSISNINATVANLRMNLINAPFKNLNHYLDVWFRLLKEDFMGPLRLGLKEYGSPRDGKFKKYEHIFVYNNAYATHIEAGKSCMTHVISVSVAEFKYFNIEHTKRFKHNNLVIFSNDEFKSNFVCGIIIGRNMKGSDVELKVSFQHYWKGLLERSVNDLNEVGLNEATEALGGIELLPLNSRYKIIEPRAFFGAYYDLINNAQTVGDIPLKDFIVSVERPIADAASALFPFNYENEDTFTDYDKTILDSSQAKALKMAATHKVCLVQGPPGTGKSFIGVKLIKHALRNMKHDKSPILVLCYTNHALDLFMESLYHEGICSMVRIGSRSKSELIASRNIKKLARSSGMNAIHESRISSQIEQLGDFRDKTDKYNKSFERILPFGPLRPFLSPRADEYFVFFDKGFRDVFRIDPIAYWLGCYGVPHIEPYIRKAYMMYTMFRDMNFEMEGSGTHAAFDMMSSNRLLEVFERAKLNELNEENLRSSFGLDFADLAIAVKFSKLHEIKSLIWWLWIVEYCLRTGDSASEATLFCGFTRRQIKRFLPPDVGENSHVILRWFLWALEGQHHPDTVSFSFEELKLFVMAIVDDAPKGEVFKFPEFYLRNRMGRQEADAVVDLDALSLEDRHRLYRNWAHRYRSQFVIKENNATILYDLLQLKRKRILQQSEGEYMKTVQVIGATTSGAASQVTALREAGVRIAVVEEAAEVLEPHIVMALPPTVERLIMIGDHLQLKPKCSNVILERKYNLNVSLFERLVINNLPYVTLEYQHRMRPHIADLIRPEIYKDLKDSEVVCNYPSVKGVSKNIFLMQHDKKENVNLSLDSKENKFEADFLLQLALYLLKQGYRQEQITVLTGYSAQAILLKNHFSVIKDVIVRTVDEYQGEENDILLISFVRSNEENTIGFLAIQNRLCVAFSRAKMGMYCVGNFLMFKKDNDFWKSIVRKCHANNEFGTSLPLRCAMHGNITNVQDEGDFKHVQEGGCAQPCDSRLPCGHACPRSCHPDDALHEEYRCQRVCEFKDARCGHTGKKKCGEAMPDCKEIVKHECRTCKQFSEERCHTIISNRFNCRKPCVKTLPCGHPCAKLCGSSICVCNTNVTISKLCGHKISVRCGSSAIYSSDSIECSEPCKATLACGHQCQGTCSKCLQGLLHVKCGEKCNKQLNCGHTCGALCGPCPPCEKTCDGFCSHSKCTLPCFRVCAPCKEECKLKCKHHQCTSNCGGVCKVPPCNEPCEKKLKCGHPCIGLCGEKCPSLCKICDEDEVTEIFFGNEDLPEARFIQLTCNHLFESTGLDQYLNGREERFRGVKSCPTCRAPIRGVRRYMSLTNELLLAFSEGKKENDDLFFTWRMKHTEKIAFTLGRHLKDDMFPKYVHRNVYENNIKYLEKLFKWKITTFFCNKNCCKTLLLQLQKSCESLIDIFLGMSILSEQQRLESNQELCRVLSSSKLVVSGHPDLPGARELLHDMKHPFTNERNAKLRKIFEEYEIKQVEDFIINTPDYSNPSTKVYRCPNGHLYSIGNCGQAATVSRCLECGIEIGGTNHVLLPNNTRVGR